MSQKEYLGDSVYIEFNDGEFILTTENGYPTDPHNEIFLDVVVADALVRYINNTLNEKLKSING